MLRSYLIIALRSLRKRLGAILINITGLAVGLAACLLIGLWVERELSYDDVHPQTERIHRIALDAKLQDRELRGATTPAPLDPTLVNNLPEVETATRFRFDQSTVFHVEAVGPTMQTTHMQEEWLENIWYTYVKLAPGASLEAFAAKLDDVVQQWLEDFAYRIELGAGVFLGAGALACTEALLTVSYQAFRAARLDPALTLRDE